MDHTNNNDHYDLSNLFLGFVCPIANRNIAMESKIKVYILEYITSKIETGQIA